MNQLNCEEMLPLLSAYHDGELPAAQRQDVEGHLTGCPQCQMVLESFRAMFHLASRLQLPSAPDRWPELQTALERGEAETTVSGTALSSGTKRRSLAPLIAAILLVGVGFGIWWSWQHQRDHALQVNFDGFLTEFVNNPVSAERILVSKYDGQPVNFQQAIEKLKYRPAVVDHMPADYQLVSANLLKMPCCQCLQALFKRPNGNYLCVFEHDLEQPIWFGDRKALDTTCAGKECRLVQADGFLAATWKRDRRFITLIGTNDLNELTRILTHLNRKVSGIPKMGL